MLNKYFTWTSLTKLGNNKISKTSYFWLLFVPIIVKLIAPLNRQLSFVILNEKITLSIDLPFSWKVFFIVAVLFSIANFLYSIRCPDIIKDYKSYTDFEAEGKTGKEIITTFSEFYDKWKEFSKFKKDKLKDFLIYNLHHYTSLGMTFDAGASKRILTPLFEEHSKEEEIFNEKKWHAPKTILKDPKTAFWQLRAMLNHLHKFSRFLIGIFYAIGLALTTIIIIQNIYFVVKHICQYGFFSA